MWRIPRESTEWVGPVDVEKVVNATGTPVTEGVQFAVLLKGTRPDMTDDSTDWGDPVNDPDGAEYGFGVMVDPVTDEATYGIWTRVASSPEDVVLEPDEGGGWIYRS